MVSSDLLSVTLALTLVSFIATLYVIVRTLTPLVGPHVLSRYSRPTNPLPVFGYASPSPEKVQLRSAQRFQCWLAVVDLASSAVWLWEVISLAGGSPNSPARMAFAICARPTILLVVSLLSYLNVIRGKVVDLGTCDFIVWIPSVVLLAIMVALAAVAPATSSKVWEGMMGVETALLAICSLCFGRLLLAVFRVRRDTLRSHALRHQMMMEEKEAEQERAMEEAEARRQAIADAPPCLPPMKTNRWLISKTFLLKKASSAANTVHTSLHRRSQSGAATLAGRPSTASELPRLSFSSHEQATNDPNVPYSFLNHDPAKTARFGHLRAEINAQTESQLHPSNAPASPVITPRAVSFDIDTAARGASPAPVATTEARSGALSRMTDFTRISIDQPRPSMGSYMSYESVSSESAVAGYLSGAKLAHNGYQGRCPGLSRKEARKAGARMGGHLLNCVATWTLIMPFLVYKMQSPTRPAPLYASILVALGLSLSGPLLALQTIIAEGGFWYAKSVPPLMASSSAVAFEHLNSRGGTPTPNFLAPQSATLSQPNSASTDITQATAQSAATGNTTSSHRSSSSNDSVSSLASIAAFSHPAPGTFRHSLDTQEAPSTILGRALAMAAPHPKLQIMKAKTGIWESSNIENIDIENGLPDHDPELRKRESRKLKAYSMSRNSVVSLRSNASQRERRRSNTIGMATEKSWDDLENAAEFGMRTPHRRSALAMKDANSLTAAILAEKKRTPPRTPSVYSFTLKSSQGTSAHERRRSAPITPSSYRSIDESGVWVPKAADHSNYNIDSLTASLLTSMLPGMRISASAQPNAVTRHSLHRSKSREEAFPNDIGQSQSMSRKKRPGLSLDLSSDGSAITRADEAYAAMRRDQVNESPTLSKAKATGNNGSTPSTRPGQHLRNRSRKSISYAIQREENDTPEKQLPIDETHITRRRAGKPRLSPAKELRESEDLEPGLRPSFDTPVAPRPSLEDRSLVGDESFDMVQKSEAVGESRIEVLSEGGNNATSHSCEAATNDSVSTRAPTIIIRTKASVTSQEDVSADQEELGTVSMATRIARSPSVSSFGSEGILRPLSSASLDENAYANRSRSSTLGSLTSEGFRNMIQSNRTSWTGSELGNESISALLERQGALAEAITSPAHALQARDKNTAAPKLSGSPEDEKTGTSSPAATPTNNTFGSQGPGMRGVTYVSPQRVQLSEVRSTRGQSVTNENVPPSAISIGARSVQRSVQPAAGIGRTPRLTNQRSIMSLR